SAGRCVTVCCRVGTPSGSCASPTRRVRTWQASWPVPTRCRPKSKYWRSCARFRVSEKVRKIVQTRVHNPEAIAEAARERVKPKSLFGSHGKTMIIAADHPARGANAVGGDPLAMADRGELLDR